ncbi:MAG TPA: superoxide dismutase [Xanthobacteraceae bacterium]|nr:superoxide dismutase [Xanthobacteraceae bacterium]
MAFELPPLPYAEDALEPVISARTMQFHHGKHHKKYVDTLNELTAGKPLGEKSLTEVIQETAKNDEQRKIFNNAAQVWNHTFFWNCMKPGGGGAPTGELARRIDKDFGGFDQFKKEFATVAVNQFGSGWAWLVDDNGRLKAISTPNAVPPMIQGQKALLTCDVWEHAYYLDYQNRRPDFVQAFLDNLVNWDFAAQQA